MMLEKWREYYSDNDIQRIHSILLESLSVFSSICDKLHIKWMLYGGSMLGAVKYEGFVPWDDDLDLCMFREDYETFIKEAPKLLPKEYEIQHVKITYGMPFLNIKFRRKDTTMSDYATHRVNINHGIYFDVYPIDYLPDSIEEYRHNHKVFSIYSRLFSLRQRPDMATEAVSFGEKVKFAIRCIIRCGTKLVPLLFIYRQIERIETKYNVSHSHRMGNYYYPHPVNYFLLPNNQETIACSNAIFEGRNVLLPPDYQTNLANRYGNISEDPPVEKRFGHRPYILKFDRVDATE